jgi:MarR family
MARFTRTGHRHVRIAGRGPRRFSGLMTAPPATDTALGVDLLEVVARIDRLANQQVRTRLPYARARLLSVIEEHGPARLCDLAALDYCSQPTVTTQVRLLAGAGLVSRTTDSADARAALISITAEGPFGVGAGLCRRRRRDRSTPGTTR